VKRKWFSVSVVVSDVIYPSQLTISVHRSVGNCVSSIECCCVYQAFSVLINPINITIFPLKANMGNTAQTAGYDQLFIPGWQWWAGYRRPVCSSDIVPYRNRTVCHPIPVDAVQCCSIPSSRGGLLIHSTAMLRQKLRSFRLPGRQQKEKNQAIWTTIGSTWRTNLKVNWLCVCLCWVSLSKLPAWFSPRIK